MSDSDPGQKKGGAPSWQSATPEKTDKGEDKPAPAPESREKVMEQAKRFLEEDEVKDASTDKKIAFLEGKGLRSEEIQELLGVSRNEEASSPPQVSQTPTTSNLPPPPPPPPTQIYAPSPPPIITYPEFLTTPAHPTPLVTRPRLLTTLYAFASLTALLYGTSTYLVSPMLASLTTSRLSLASTASQNLAKLIAKLEAAVSVIPETQLSPVHKIETEAEAEEEDEDPTELFHRDIGVQTSPPHSRSGSVSPAPSPSLVGSQVERLQMLKTHLEEIQTESTKEGENTGELETTMGLLREYLDGFAYTVPSYAGNYGFVGGAGAGGKDEDDEIGRVKAGIRGVKGVLLSARSFPGGVRGR